MKTFLFKNIKLKKKFLIETSSKPSFWSLKKLSVLNCIIYIYIIFVSLEIVIFGHKKNSFTLYQANIWPLVGEVTDKIQLSLKFMGQI